MTLPRSEILNSKDVWSIVLDYCGEPQITELKEELKHQQPAGFSFKRSNSRQA